MATNEQIHAAQAELNMLYDDFFAKYGLINSRDNDEAKDAYHVVVMQSDFDRL